MQTFFFFNISQLNYLVPTTKVTYSNNDFQEQIAMKNICFVYNTNYYILTIVTYYDLFSVLIV